MITLSLDQWTTMVVVKCVQRGRVKFMDDSNKLMPTKRQRYELLEQFKECDMFEPGMTEEEITQLIDSGQLGDRRLVWVGSPEKVTAYRYSGPETVQLGGYIQGTWIVEDEDEYSTFSPHVEAML